MEQAVLLSAVRTPVGKFQGGLAPVPATLLGATVVREAVHRAGIEPEQVDEVILGNVLSAGLGQNPARQAALRGGLAHRVSAMTVNKVCGSGLKAVGLAVQAIQTGNAEVVVAGGMESMSNAPYLIPKERSGLRLGHGELVDSMILDGLWDVYEDCHMGITAEVVAAKYGIRREELDEFAVQSHRKAVAATRACRFESQMVPVEVPQSKSRTVRIEKRRIAARGQLARGAGPAEASFPEGRHGDRRQCSGNERRGGGGGRGLRIGGEPTGTRPPGPRGGPVHQRRRSPDGDDGSGGSGESIAG